MTPTDTTDPSAEKRILIIDDEPSIREPIGRFLTSRGYEVHTAASASEASALFARHQFGVTMCDVRMPGRSGLELLPDIRQRDPDCAVIMLTGINDAATATESLALGATDYLTKPVELERLAASISQALKTRHARIEQRDLEHLVREEVALRTAGLEREKLTLRAHAVEVLATLVTLTEAKIPFHAGHARRVAALAARLASSMGLDADTVELISTAGRIHDIGKIVIPDATLAKAAALTPEEMATVREHVRIGVDLLAPLRHLAPILPYVQDHHERWDGSGYPNGKHGTAISIGGRVLALADAYVAVTAGRPYSTALDSPEAVTYLAERSGVHFDPEVVAALHALAATSSD